ncbi:MAG: hypothetical protein O3B73_04005, partial [bacterium]|nr:hypothetical protein [bacterium]
MRSLNTAVRICIILASLGLSAAAAVEDGVEQDYFARAIKRDPTDLLAHLNYQRILLASGQSQELKATHRTY